MLFQTCIFSCEPFPLTGLSFPLPSPVQPGKIKLALQTQFTDHLLQEDVQFGLRCLSLLPQSLPASTSLTDPARQQWKGASSPRWTPLKGGLCTAFPAPEAQNRLNEWIHVIHSWGDTSACPVLTASLGYTSYFPTPLEISLARSFPISQSQWGQNKTLPTKAGISSQWLPFLAGVPPILSTFKELWYCLWWFLFKSLIFNVKFSWHISNQSWWLIRASQSWLQRDQSPVGSALSLLGAGMLQATECSEH